MKACLTCRFWREFVDEPDMPAGERLGSCAFAVSPLPYAWRYARREVVSTYGDDGAECATYEKKD